MIALLILQIKQIFGNLYNTGIEVYNIKINLISINDKPRISNNQIFKVIKVGLNIKNLQNQNFTNNYLDNKNYKNLS